MGVTGSLRSVKHKIEKVRFPPELDATKHYARLVMGDRLDTVIGGLDPATKDAVEVSGDLHEHRPWKSYTALRYPEFDVTDESAPPPGEWDVVLCDQVLEHVADPWAAARNLARLTRPGGTVIVSTPFLIRVHPDPNDYWRFTEEGLRLLLSQSLTVTETGSWGNPAAVRANLYVWPRRRAWQPLRNNPETPVVVWAVAVR